MVSRDQQKQPKVNVKQMKGVNLMSKPKAKPNSIVKTEKLVNPNRDPEDEALLNDPDRSESDGPEDDPTPKK